MNLNQITSGTDYAFFPSRGRGEEFRWCNRGNDKWYDGTYSDKYFVYRVKAIRAFSHREIGNKRDTGYVEVFWLTNAGEFKTDDLGEYLTRTVRVRDLATVWEDYEDTHDYESVKRDKEEQEEQEWLEQRRLIYEREEQERQEQQAVRIALELEERERIENERKLYIQKIEQHYGLPAESVTTNGTTLFLNKEVIDAAIDKETEVSNG